MSGSAPIQELSTTAAAGLRTVSRFEAVLLRMLRGFLRPGPVDTPLSERTSAAGKLAMPKGLSPQCLHLVRDTLGKGCVQYLARAGGWRREKHLRQGKPAQGRLWERTPASELGLSFSHHSIHLLMWLAAGRPDKDSNWNPPQHELTIGDKLLMLVAYQGLRDHEARQTFLGRTLFVNHGLIRVFFPEDFASLPAGASIDTRSWTQGIGASVLEALQPKLLHRWLELERGKSQIGDWNRMRGIGASQERALESLLSDCEAAKRPDLARWLLKTMSELLSRDLTAAFWLSGLQQASSPARLSERLEVQRFALAALKQVERLSGWTHRARSTGYLDEDYSVAQLWLADWEQYCGDEVAVIAQQLLRQLEPLRVEPMPAAGAPANASGAAAARKKGSDT
jgi:FtsH ternary system domain X6